MNSKLYNNVVMIPNSLLKYLNDCFNSTNGDTNTEGWKRNQELRQQKQIKKGWKTINSDTVLEGYKSVNTITLSELMEKYKIVFDTLIIDCEGAFYYILKDMPDILNNIKLIITENDYRDINHKNYIDTILKENNFYVDYFEKGSQEALDLKFPCYLNFYEVWKRN